MLFCTSSDTSDYPKCLRIRRDLPKYDEEFLEFLESMNIELDDEVSMPFSSGTGGLPKCVILSHRNYSAATAILKK